MDTSTNEKDMMPTEVENVQVTVTMPRWLRDVMQSAADINCRSVSGEICFRVKQTLPKE